ncbi:hypothetical protein HYW94_01075 [Candidatus Uhrbacteria bacterium]|nr:hypothetical protein [Candidatus Uhrbacteria bacterium]
MKYFIIAVTSVIIGVTGVAFFVIGSPFSARLQRFDELRVSDLQNIQSNIIHYWQTREQIPQTLAELNDPISGFRVPRDPEYGTDYEFEKKGDLRFSMCATFAQESKNDISREKRRYIPVSPAEKMPVFTPVETKGYDTEWNWKHTAGRFCFERIF